MFHTSRWNWFFTLRNVFCHWFSNRWATVGGIHSFIWWHLYTFARWWCVLILPLPFWGGMLLSVQSTRDREVSLSDWISLFFPSKHDTAFFKGEDLFFDHKHSRRKILCGQRLYFLLFAWWGHKPSLHPALVARLCSGLRGHIFGSEQAYHSMIFCCWFCLHCIGTHPIRNNAPSNLLFTRQLKKKNTYFNADSVRRHLRDWKHYQCVGRVPYDSKDIEQDHHKLSDDASNFFGWSVFGQVHYYFVVGALNNWNRIIWVSLLLSLATLMAMLATLFLHWTHPVIS